MPVDRHQVENFLYREARLMDTHAYDVRMTRSLSIPPSTSPPYGGVTWILLLDE